MRQYIFKILIEPIDCLEKTPGEKSRPVIVKFLRYNTRGLIYKNKKKLKGSRISITENLTSKRITILQRAREDDRFIYPDAVSKEFNCIIIKVHSHDTLGCLKWKEKIVLAFVFYFYFGFVVCFREEDAPTFFSYVCLLRKHL